MKRVFDAVCVVVKRRGCAMRAVEGGRGGGGRHHLHDEKAAEQEHAVCAVLAVAAQTVTRATHTLNPQTHTENPEPETASNLLQ